MKDFLKFLTINAGLMVVYYFVLILTVFEIGYASNGKHLTGQRILVVIFCLIQIASYFIILRVRNEFKPTRFVFYSILILLAWTTLGLVNGL